MMPDVDGFQLLHELKADPSTRDIPVIIVTSRHLDDIERASLLQLAVSVLNKATMSRESALACIQQAMQRAEAA